MNPKVKKALAGVRYSETPPPGWPTEKQWKKIEAQFRSNRRAKARAGTETVLEAKRDLCSHFVRHAKRSKISQRQLASQLDVSESRVSEILHYNVERFTIDKLLELLSKIKPRVKLKVA